jgi:hypothetical protein
MTKHTRLLLALALVLALVGLGAVYGTGVRGNDRSESSATPAPSACGKQRLSHYRILLLGHGPLTRRAASELICGGSRS